MKGEIGERNGNCWRLRECQEENKMLQWDKEKGKKQRKGRQRRKRTFLVAIKRLVDAWNQRGLWQYSRLDLCALLSADLFLELGVILLSPVRNPIHRLLQSSLTHLSRRFDSCGLRESRSTSWGSQWLSFTQSCPCTRWAKCKREKMKLKLLKLKAKPRSPKKFVWHFFHDIFITEEDNRT